MFLKSLCIVSSRFLKISLTYIFKSIKINTVVQNSLKISSDYNIERERNYMMKKTGFTLAEVLITLTIIGVVATMTLPALMTNVQEQQAKTGLKKGLNTLTEAAQMNQAVEGFDYGSITEASDASKPDGQSMYGILYNRTQIDAAKSALGSATPESNLVHGGATPGTNFVVFFRDGSAVSFKSAAQSTADVTTPDADGLPHGFGVLYDINGEKRPNVLSNCQKKITGLQTETTGSECTKAQRVIRDQFSVRLRGAFAQPNGPAARWAASN